MEKNEMNKRFQTDTTYRALIRASRQLELCGYCPKVKGNKLRDCFHSCDIAQKDGIAGCHRCIAEHFLAWARNPLGRAGNTDELSH